MRHPAEATGPSQRDATVLVTGANGFLGRHLVRALSAAGRPVVALSRSPTGDHFPEGANVSTIARDLRDAGACARALSQARSVIHLAAVRNRPDQSVVAMREVNEEATQRFARQALDAGVRRFVHVSTALVFGPSSDALDESARLVVEEERIGPYAAGKARTVRALRTLRDAGAPIAIVHPTLVYGPDDPSHPNRVSAQIRRLHRRRWDVVLAGGRARRDLVHVDDVVAALLAVERADGPPYPELLVAGEAVSQRDLARRVAELSGRPRPLVISLPVTFARAVARIADRLRGLDRRGARAGYARAVETLASEWVFRNDRLRDYLGRPLLPLAAGIAGIIEGTKRERT